MKRILVLMVFFSVTITSQSFASASDYRIDDNVIESVFDQAIQVKTGSFDLFSGAFDSSLLGNEAVLEGKSPVVAWLICWLIGGLAIHRIYLGGTPVLILGYLALAIPIGIPLLIVVFGDWIALLIDVFRDDLGKHEGSDALIMW